MVGGSGHLFSVEFEGDVTVRHMSTGYSECLQPYPPTLLAMRKLGAIVAIQVQRDRIKIKGEDYLPHLIQQVQAGAISGGGLFGHHDGSWIVDVHHPMHPTGKGKAHRAVSFGFTSHYTAMSDRFGGVAPYIAGENLIVDTADVVARSDAAAGFVIRTADGDIEMEETHVLLPCREFTSHLLGLDEPAEKEAIADDLAFLGDGMRGFGAGIAVHQLGAIQF